MDKCDACGAIPYSHWEIPEVTPWSGRPLVVSGGVEGQAKHDVLQLRFDSAQRDIGRAVAA